MAFLTRFYQSLIAFGNGLQSPFLFLIRLYWGGSFFLSGMSKWENVGQIAQYFQTLHIPFPAFNAHVTALVELCGGGLLLLGLASRLAALPLIITMIIAYLTAEFDSVKMLFSNPGLFTSRAPFLFLLATLIIFIFGPGAISIDYLIEKIRKRKTS